jgi:hypothetical protein
MFPGLGLAVLGLSWTYTGQKSTQVIDLPKKKAVYWMSANGLDFESGGAGGI